MCYHVLNTVSIKKEAEVTKLSLEARRDKKPQMTQRLTKSVSSLLDYCNKVLYLCKRIEILQAEIRKTKLERQHIKDILEQ